jgi:ATP-binding cassette subfamily C protein
MLDLVLHPVGEGRFPFAHAVARLLAVGDQTQRLLILIGAVAVLMVARAGVLSQRDRLLNRLQMEFVEAIRARLIARIAGARWSDIVRIRHARMVQALSVEIHQIGVAAHSILLTVVALAMLTAHCVLALALAPTTGAIAIGFAVLGVLISRPYLTRARSLGRAITEAHFGMTDGALSFLSGLKVAAAQGQGGAFVDEHRRVSLAAMRDRLAFAGQQSGLRAVTTASAAAIGAATVVFGVAVAHLEPPVLITLLLVLSRMSGPAQILQQGAQQVLHSLPAYGVALSLEAALGEAPPDVAEGHKPSVRPDAPILLRGVTYRHAEAADTPLKNLDLTLPSGAFVGIVGPSGTGKTTFLDLVAGVLSAEAGRISVHGYDLEGAGLAVHRPRIAYVAQDSFLFDDTIRRNLDWARPGCSETDMRQALDLVGAGDLLARLGDDLDSRVGERGGLVSAGERQRLALARALLRDPAILILDEATNAIDLAGERAILERLDRLRPRTTILMVAHRNESLAFCDCLLTFPGATMRLAPAPAVRAV